MRRTSHFAPLGALALAAATAASCKREAQQQPLPSSAPSAAPSRFKPSNELGILLPTTKGMTAPRDGGVLLDFGAWGGGPFTLGYSERGGLYVAGDGLVWSYRYRYPDAGFESSSPCDISRSRKGSPERYACLHSDSNLVAKLEPSLLEALKRDAAVVGVSDRIEWGSGGADAGGVVLEVPGRGHEGSPLELASCGNNPAWQRTSPEAVRIISLFRRIRRALGGAWRFVGARCGDLEPRREIAPGVIAWWSYED